MCSAPSTTNRISPRCVASLSLIARSIAVSVSPRECAVDHPPGRHEMPRDAFHAHRHHRPDAPPPPNPPPPPLKPPPPNPPPPNPPPPNRHRRTAAQTSSAKATPAHAAAQQREQECDHPRDQRNGDRACQHPGDDGDGPAGDERAGKPAQHGVQHPTHHEREDHHDGEDRPDPPGPAGAPFFRFRQRLAVDHAEDPVDPGGDAPVEIPLTEPRHDDLADDPLAGGVGERPFQAVPDLDPQRPVVLRDDKNAHRHPRSSAPVSTAPRRARRIARSIPARWRER